MYKKRILLTLPLDTNQNSNCADNLYNTSKRSGYSWILVSLAFCFAIWRWLSVGHHVLQSEAIIEGDYISWYKCDDHIECGRLRVPLDYADLSPGRRHVTLSLARYPATNKKERIGTLLLNPGGPGGSGVAMIYETGPSLSAILEGRYDLVSWDPRGVNGTTPRITCFPSKTAQDVFYANTEQPIPFRNLSDPFDLEAWVAQVRIADARTAVLAELCHRRSQDTLDHVGTATVARDMERLFRVLEDDDEPVNYWGFSYGTALGSYFVNMFPDRVGRVIIDGVINPVMWSSQPVYLYPHSLYADVERDLENFCAACASAGPDRCALASNESTPRSILNTIDGLLRDLYERPLPVVDASRPGSLTQGGMSKIIFDFLYNPRGWTQLAEILSFAIQGNATAVINNLQPPLELDPNVPDRPVFSVLTAVTCTDAPPFDPSSNSDILQLEIEESVLNFQSISRHFGPLGVGVPFPFCQHWKGKATERFTGPFNHSLSNDILIIGNTADPVTPLAGARAVNSLLHHSSRLIIQDGNGHCSVAQVSLCTVRAIKAYLLYGELPENGILCPVNERLFPSPTVGGPGTPSSGWLLDEDERFSEEDVQLLELWKGLGKHMEPFIGVPKKL